MSTINCKGAYVDLETGFMEGSGTVCGKPFGVRVCMFVGFLLPSLVSNVLENTREEATEEAG